MKKFAPALIAFAAFLWALDGILRRSLYVLPAVIIVFYEHFLEAVLIAPLTLRALKKEISKINFRLFLLLLFISAFSSVLGTLLFTSALAQINYLPFSVVFLLQKLQPIFAISAAAIILKEKITSAYLKWAVLAFAAAYFLTFPTGQINLATGSGTLIAALLSVGAAFCWGSSTALSRYGLLRLSPLLMTGLRFMLAVPVAFIAVLVLNQSQFLIGLNFSQLSRLFIIALSTGLFAQWLYYRGLQFTQAKVATIMELTLPLTAVFIDLFYYHHPLVPIQYLAAVILLFSIYQVSRLNHETRR